MARPEHVVGRLRAPQELPNATCLANRREGLAPPREQLVRIRLVAHVPDQPIAGRLEHVVKHQGQFDRPEARREVTAGLGHLLDDLAPECIRDLLKALRRQPPQVGRKVD